MKYKVLTILEKFEPSRSFDYRTYIKETRRMCWYYNSRLRPTGTERAFHTIVYSLYRRYY